MEALRLVLRDKWGLGLDGRWLEGERKAEEGPLRGVVTFALKSQMQQTKFEELRTDVEGSLQGLMGKAQRLNEGRLGKKGPEGRGSTWKGRR